MTLPAACGKKCPPVLSHPAPAPAAGRSRSRAPLCRLRPRRQPTLADGLDSPACRRCHKPPRRHDCLRGFFRKTQIWVEQPVYRDWPALEASPEIVRGIRPSAIPPFCRALQGGKRRAMRTAVGALDPIRSAQYDLGHIATKRASLQYWNDLMLVHVPLLGH
jgi:hypothetical protein